MALSTLSDVGIICSSLWFDVHYGGREGKSGPALQRAQAQRDESASVGPLTLLYVHVATNGFIRNSQSRLRSKSGGCFLLAISLKQPLTRDSLLIDNVHSDTDFRHRLLLRALAARNSFAAKPLPSVAPYVAVACIQQVAGTQ